MDRTQIVLCIPYGGINDMMTQILISLDYCKRSGRKCIIDTVRVSEFEHNIYDFFDLSSEQITRVSSADFYSYVEENTQLKIFPPIISHAIIRSFKADRWDPTHGCRTLNNIPLLFDISKAYSEDIIVRATSGGGNYAARFLKTFPPKPIILDELRRRYTELGPDYLAVHIRNTDYKSDVSGFLAEQDALIKSAPTVFLASDDPATVSSIKMLYGNKVKTFATLLVDRRVLTQHHQCGKPASFVIDAVCDLLLLGLSTTYIHSASPSGYSRNARYLHQDPEFRSYYKRLLSGV